MAIGLDSTVRKLKTKLSRITSVKDSHIGAGISDECYDGNLLPRTFMPHVPLWLSRACYIGNHGPASDIIYCKTLVVFSCVPPNFWYG